MGNVHVKKREVTRAYAKAHLPRVSWEAERSGELDSLYCNGKLTSERCAGHGTMWIEVGSSNLKSKNIQVDRKSVV